jgi:hypothetical protein
MKPSFMSVAALSALVTLGHNAAAQPAAGEARVADREKEWTERRARLDEASTLTGGTGLLHLQHAQGAATGQFRIGFSSEYLSADFLCSGDFPCRDPNDPTKTLKKDDQSHFGGRLTLSAQLADWLEAYLATSALSNSNPANRPATIQVVGDTGLGAKVHGALSKVFHVGGGAELWLLNGVGSVGLDGSATSAKFRGLATADFRGTEQHIPFRMSANVTYSLDNSGEVVSDIERTRAAPITRIERFALNVNRVDHLDLDIGAEGFVVDDRIRPFAELSILVPINRQGSSCRPNNPSADKCLETDGLVPSTFSFGGRVFPWKRGFSLLAAMDVGLSGVHSFIEELRPTAQWMLYLGAGWSVETEERLPVIKEVPVASGRKERGRKIRGLVHEEGTTTGIAGATVAWQNHPELTSLSTGSDGRFTTQDLPPDTYAFAIQAEGYRSGQCTATMPPLGPPSREAKGSDGDVEVYCVMQPLPRVGNIVVRVRDLETGDLMRGARLKVVDAAQRELSGSTDSEGAFRFELVTPGQAAITAYSDGYLISSQKLEVKSRQDSPLDFTLKKSPKTANVVLQEKEIALRQQVQFEADWRRSLRLRPASSPRSPTSS